MYCTWTSGIAVLALAACSAQQTAPQPAPTLQSAAAQQTCIIGEGTASWYHVRAKGHGESGELVAAHRSLPLGTLVQVTALDTGRTVTVRISGRGPFRHGRIIDLSESAADELGIRHNGVGSVQLGMDGVADQACPVREARLIAG
jgi:rare lipoprotein A